MKPIGYQIASGPTKEQAGRIKIGMWKLLSTRTERYLMGDSSSVRVEVAGELLESILFTLSICQSDLSCIDSETNLEELFDTGLAELNRQLGIGKQMLAGIPAELMAIPNQPYQCIYSDLNDFFRTYDIYYFAHETPGLDGYPLCQPVTDCKGIFYVNEYLRRFLIENRFCKRFELDAVLPLLYAHCRYLKYHVCNFFELLFACAVSLCMLHKSPFSLHITDADRTQLAEMITAWSEEECVIQFTEESLRLGRLLGLREDGDKEYCLNAARLLAIRVYSHQDCLDVLLPSPSSMDKSAEPQFVDGNRMDDERLRELIATLNDLPIQDRILKTRDEVRSVSDLTEILGTSFWGEECMGFFSELSDVELTVLLYTYYAKKKLFQDWRSPTGWENELQRYLAILPLQRKNNIQNSAGAMMRYLENES